jgi:hypothetical protein
MWTTRNSPGPFSRTLAVPVDAFSTQPALPDRTSGTGRGGRALPEPRQQTVVVTTLRRELPDHVTPMDALQSESNRLVAPAAPLSDDIADAA